MPRHSRIFTLATLLLFLVPATLWAGTDEKKKELPQIKLLERGKGKRQKLRYKATRGASERLQMDMDMSMQMSMGGQALTDIRIPTMRIRMDLDVTDVTREGNLRYQFRYAGMELLDTPGVLPEMRTAMEQALAGMKSLQGHALVNDRGLTLEAGFEGGALADPQLRQFLGSLEQSIQQLSAPLPVEAVGVGAKWEVRSRIEMNGMTMQQTARYELVELQRDRFKCKVTITQTAAAQKIQSPDMPPDAQVELVSMKGTGTGELDIDLGRLTPTSHANMVSDLEMRVQAGGQNMEMDMHMSMGMKFEPSPR